MLTRILDKEEKNYKSFRFVRIIVCNDQLDFNSTPLQVSKQMTTISKKGRIIVNLSIWVHTIESD